MANVIEICSLGTGLALAGSLTKISLSSHRGMTCHIDCPVHHTLLDDNGENAKFSGESPRACLTERES